MKNKHRARDDACVTYREKLKFCLNLIKGSIDLECCIRISQVPQDNYVKDFPYTCFGIYEKHEMKKDRIDLLPNSSDTFERIHF